MRFAKGRDGFHLVLVPAVEEHQRLTLQDHPELFRYWDAVLQRLREAGHHMGTTVDGNDSHRVASIATEYDGPVIWIAWRVLGDTVTVLKATF